MRQQRWSTGLVIMSALVAMAAVPAAGAGFDRSNAVGKYALRFEAGDGNVYEPVVTIGRSGDELTIEYDVPGAGFDFRPANPRIEDGSLVFDLELDLNGEPLFSTYVLGLTDGGVDGRIDWEFQEQFGEIDVTGKRLGPPPGASVLGTWRFEFTASDGTRHEPIVTFNSRDGATAGTVDYQGGTYPLEDVKIDGDALRFRVTTESQDGPVVTTVAGRVAGGRMTGTMDYDASGETGTLDFTASQVAPAGGLAMLAGRWRVRFTAGEQDFDLLLTVGVEGDKLTASYGSDDAALPVSSIGFDDGMLNWVFESDPDGADLWSRYEGRVDGDAMQGTLEWEYGGQPGSTDFEGERDR